MPAIQNGPGSLTPDQMTAVMSPAQRILLVASAGSGKTEVLIRRLARILAESAGNSFRCLAVTYTLKAADELRSRIATSVSTEAWRVDADTLHGFALDWLRRYGDSVDIGPDVVVYSDDADRVALIHEYLASLGLQRAVESDVLGSLRPLLHQFDDHRTKRPGQPFPSDGSVFLDVPVEDLYDGYLEALTRGGGIDFPGMLTKLLEALELDDWLGDNFRSLYRHVLLDEGQDLTAAQTAVLRAFVRDDVDLFVVADDRQSINGYAGGSFENARRLVGADVASSPLTLRHNFRSSARVMHAAESLAEYFASRSLKGEAVENAPPGSVKVHECADPDEEASRIGAWVSQLLANGLRPSTITEGEDPTLSPEQIAVIGRTRWVLDPVLAHLESRAITTAVQVERSGFLASPEARVVLDALALEAVPADAPAKRRLIEELEELEALEITVGGDALTALQTASLDSLKAVSDMIVALRADRALDVVFDSLQGDGVNSWADDAAKIRTLWADYCVGTRVPARNLSDFLRYVSRVQRTRPSDPGVRVMTIHRAKGLEFRAVAVVGVREGAIPDFRARSASELDAERRSFYVAITRASRDLLLTWPRRTVDRYGRVHAQAPSRFLNEAGLTGQA